MKTALPLALALAMSPLAALAEEPAATAPAAPPSATAARKHLLEVTFGTSQAFNGNPQQLLDSTSRVLPTAAASLILEWLAGERFAEPEDAGGDHPRHQDDGFEVHERDTSLARR